MTANELADAIEKGGKDGFFQDEIIAILRQQQAEIEALEKAFEGERKYARYLSKLCIDNKIPIVWSF
jgi:hypothetical protein